MQFASSHNVEISVICLGHVLCTNLHFLNIKLHPPFVRPAHNNVHVSSCFCNPYSIISSSTRSNISLYHLQTLTAHFLYIGKTWYAHYENFSFNCWVPSLLKFVTCCTVVYRISVSRSSLLVLSLDHCHQNPNSDILMMFLGIFVYIFSESIFSRKQRLT